MTRKVALLVSDVDGTLVDAAKQLRAATVAAVARLRESGVAFTIVSARPRSGMVAIARRLGIDAPIAAFNGGRVFTLAGETLFHATIDPALARAAHAMAGDSDVWVFADDRWYAIDGDGPHTASERVTAAQEPVTGALPDDVLDHADKITFVDDDADQLTALAERLTARFGDAATIVRSQTYYLDVTAREADKGQAIARLADLAGVPLAQVAAIGDQANDVPMLERAGTAIAMGNAPDAVKARADRIARTNDDDGVAHAIDDFILRSGE